MGSRCRALAITIAVLAALPACGNASVTPTPGTYTVDYPSLGAAIASKSVTLNVYARDDSSEQCLALLEAVNPSALANLGALGAPLQTIPTSACDLDAHDGGALSLRYGTYAVLAVVTKAPEDGGLQDSLFLYGCTIATISATSPSVVVSVKVVDPAIPIPPAPSNCGLRAFCAQHKC